MKRYNYSEEDLYKMYVKKFQDVSARAVKMGGKVAVAPMSKAEFKLVFKAEKDYEKEAWGKPSSSANIIRRIANSELQTYEQKTANFMANKLREIGLKNVSATRIQFGGMTEAEKQAYKEGVRGYYGKLKDSKMSSYEISRLIAVTYYGSENM